MWIILRLKGLGNEIINWGCGVEALTVQYCIFRIYEYFYNLVMSKVIINALLFNPISVLIVKV